MQETVAIYRVDFIYFNKAAKNFISEERIPIFYFSATSHFSGCTLFSLLLEAPFIFPLYLFRNGGNTWNENKEGTNCCFVFFFVCRENKQFIKYTDRLYPLPKTYNKYISSIL